MAAYKKGFKPTSSEAASVGVDGSAIRSPIFPKGICWYPHLIKLFEKKTLMETCDYKTAVSCASRKVDWAEDEDGYQLTELTKTIIELLTTMYPSVDIGKIMADLNEAVYQLIEDSRVNDMQDQDDASRRAEQLLDNPPKIDD